MTKNNLKDLKRVCSIYGYEAQSRQAIEEMAELTQAINKKWRKETQAGYAVSETAKQKDWNDSITEEIADVYICLKQIEMLLNIEDDVNVYVDKKIERTLNRIGDINE